MARINSIYVDRTNPISIKDIYWAAGFLEGEGCFHIRNRASGTRQPTLSAASTDPDTIARIVGLLGTTITGPTDNSHGLGGNKSKPIYSTILTGRRAIGWMMTLYSLLGGRRKAKILEILTIWRNQPQNKMGRPSKLVC